VRDHLKKQKLTFEYVVLVREVMFVDVEKNRRHGLIILKLEN